jgi:enoyl-CoA hydratase/carnithine racemase
MDMLLTGRLVPAKEAERFGLINCVVAPHKLAEETRNWAMEISHSSRYTLASGKQAFFNQVDLDEPAAYNYATEAMVVNCLAADAQEGMTAFLEKRQAVWKHK